MFCVIQPPNIAILTPTSTARPTWCLEVGLQNNLSEYKNSTPQPPVFQIQIQISVKQWAIIRGEIDELNMASQLPNFTLELHGDMKAN